MNDLLIQVIFYIFAAIAVFSALMVISQNNPVRCVLFLVLTFFASSVLWILVEAEFLALILVLVYVGAVMTLFLFVVMMLNIDTESIKAHLIRYLPFGLIIVALLVGLLITAVPADSFKSRVANQNNNFVTQSQLQTNILQSSATPIVINTRISNTEALGLVLYTDYLLAFELAAILLLVAIISAITLVHQGAVGSKRQNIIQQIMTRSEDRVKLISMKSEK